MVSWRNQEVSYSLAYPFIHVGAQPTPSVLHVEIVAHRAQTIKHEEIYLQLSHAAVETRIWCVWFRNNGLKTTKMFVYHKLVNNLLASSTGSQTILKRPFQILSLKSWQSVKLET